MTTIIPQLYVRDVDAYVEFLVDAFGFDVSEYWRDPNDASHVNVEVALGGALVGIGVAGNDHAAPSDLPARHSGLYVVVDDVDVHYERARQTDAVITAPPSDRPWGHRMYGAIDPEGHEWAFATPIEPA
jgi:uncharacterized glyoxalase superfamily protein PhnB